MRILNVRLGWFVFVTGPAVMLSMTSVGAEARTIKDLGTLGGSSSFARGINDPGQIIGDSTTARGDTHAFIFSPWVGHLQDLGTLGGRFARAEGISNSGQVVGQTTTAADDVSGGAHAFLWVGGAMRALPSLSGALDSEASSVNDAGQVVGSSNSRPVIWQNGRVRALFGTDVNGFATGISSNGDIVGNVTDATGAFHGFLLRNGVATNLDTIVGPQTTAEAVTDSGNVVGGYFPANSDRPHGFLYNFFSNQVRDLGVLDGGYSFAHAVASGGLVAGEGGGNSTHAVLWDNNHVIHDLGALPGADFSAAFGVNNGGTVVGVSATAQLDDHAAAWLP
jgi:probable HAF family extracellular repeat protein